VFQLGLGKPEYGSETQRFRLAKIRGRMSLAQRNPHVLFSACERARLPDFDDRLGIARALSSELLASLAECVSECCALVYVRESISRRRRGTLSGRPPRGMHEGAVKKRAPPSRGPKKRVRAERRET